MLLTCKCLNVSISIAGAEIGAADYHGLAITDVERQDPFFSTIEIGQVELGEINKEQATLVYIKHTGDWLVHECLNCRTLTHAIHKERRGNCVVVNRALLSDQQQIESLKNCDAFSHIFKVVINRDADVGSPEPTPIPKFTALHPIGPLQAGLMALQQKLQEAMRNQTSLVEELVRQFSEQQYADLEAFRKVAHEDQVSLARVLQTCSALQQQEEALTATKPPQQPTRHPKSSVKLDSVMLPLPFISPAAAAALSKAGNAPLKPRKSFSSSTASGAGDAKLNRFGVTSSPGSRSSGFGAQSSLDAEGMFDLDGMDEPTQEPLHSEEETDDTDESGSHDEGIHIPRQRMSNVAANNLARSLPVTVPIFPQSQAGSNNFDGEEQARNPQDIAASIKALAKSVHGEHNVFGDLPRPRFSTQL